MVTAVQPFCKFSIPEIVKPTLGCNVTRPLNIKVIFSCFKTPLNKNSCLVTLRASCLLSLNPSFYSSLYFLLNTSLCPSPLLLYIYPFLLFLPSSSMACYPSLSNSTVLSLRHSSFSLFPPLPPLPVSHLSLISLSLYPLLSPSLTPFSLYPCPTLLFLSIPTPLSLLLSLPHPSSSLSFFLSISTLP